MEDLTKKQILEDEVKHAENINTEVKEHDCCCSDEDCSCGRNCKSTSEDDLL